jgi:hypothetical protein
LHDPYTQRLVFCHPSSSWAWFVAASNIGAFRSADGLALLNSLIVPAKEKARRGRAGFPLVTYASFHVLRHFEMMLQVGERFARPIL